MLYPFGASEGDTALPSGSDANSGSVPLTTKLNVYDTEVDQVVVS